MGSYIGVDWAESCWMVVENGAMIEVTTQPSILAVWHEHVVGREVDSILVDIPIGLPESGPRTCYQEASSFLEGRSSSVFTIPGRDVVEADEYESARSSAGGSLGSQTWWLFPRIREVDIFLQEHPFAKEFFYESHPEVCFTKLARGALSGKKTNEGREERLDILEEQNPQLGKQIRDLIEQRLEGAPWHDRISRGKLDDVVDAAVLALTGERVGLRPRFDRPAYTAFPEHEADPDLDRILGVPMEIVFSG